MIYVGIHRVSLIKATLGSDAKRTTNWVDLKFYEQGASEAKEITVFIDDYEYARRLTEAINSLDYTALDDEADAA